MQDGPAITQQLEQLTSAWSKLNSDALGRKHQLEDALLQLGQFHDALAQLLSWIADSTGKLSEAAPPGIKTEAVELQLNELTVRDMTGVHVCIVLLLSLSTQSLDSAIASHEPTVASLNDAAQKLVTSNTADNTAEIEQDIAVLNERCAVHLRIVFMSIIHIMESYSTLYIVVCLRCIYWSITA